MGSTWLAYDPNFTMFESLRLLVATDRRIRKPTRMDDTTTTGTAACLQQHFWLLVGGGKGARGLFLVAASPSLR